MDFKGYTGIYFALTFGPPAVVIIVGCIIWKCWEKSELLMLFVMKGVISRKKIDKKATFLVCTKILKPSSKDHFMITSLFIIAICFQCFLAIAIFEVAYECSHDSDLVCFLKDNDGTFGYNNSPVNCSTITQDDIVICYRIAFDSERALIGGGAAYLVFKTLNTFLTIIVYAMLLVTANVKKKTLVYIRAVVSLLIVVVVIVLLPLSAYVNEVESAFRKVSYTAGVQFSLVALLTFFFLARLPWDELVDQRDEDYLTDASALPKDC